MKSKRTGIYKASITIVACFVLCGQSYAQQPLQTFRLDEVRLLPSPFLEAEQTDLRYMLKLEPDRLLSPYLREAGLKPKAESYGNWENTGLDGHTAGHYLTALAQMYAATGNLECKKRLDYMVHELKRCQDKDGNGYVGGVPDGMKMWADVKRGDFSTFQKKWVPWYNLHKLFAGLRDAYLLAGNTEAKTVLVKLTDWADDELAGLSTAQIQQMLNTEQGGMNEVCADVAAITGNKKYLALAEKFCHQALLNPLEQHEDKLTGLHANTQIPKVIGFERIAELNHDTSLASAAQFFWHTVAQNRSISIGGNSVREHFNPTNDFMTMLESEQGPESCNSNNMLKLTKMLFLDKPSSQYLDFYERVLYNHILSSQHPESGGFVYFTPIYPRHYRVYSTADQSFWCCVGTGMENHGKYGELIYSHHNNDLYVNLFIPSVLNWKEKGIRLTQNNRFPQQESSDLTLTTTSPKQFTLYVRKPSWIKESGFTVLVNGKAVTAQMGTTGYVSVNRVWHAGDHVHITLPMKNYAEYLPDHSSWVSFVHGPIVLAAATDTTNLEGLEANDSRWGHIATGPLYEMAKAPLLVDKGKDLTYAMQPVKGQSLSFEISDLIYQEQYKKLKLIPFYQVHDTRYMLYWPVAKADNVTAMEASLAREDAKLVKLSARTIDRVSPGEQQPETDHQMEVSQSLTGVFNNRHWRDAGDFFSYKLHGNKSVRYLQVMYYGAEKDREFDVWLNNQKLAHVKLDGTEGDHFVTKEYVIPENLKNSNPTFIVKFSASNGVRTAAIYDVRLLR